MVTGVALAERREPAHVAAREPADATPGRWVDARDLRVGDLLLRRTGELARIQGIGIRDERLAVYNLRVAELHNYAVGEGQILAHNPTDCNRQQKFGFMDEAPTSGVVVKPSKFDYFFGRVTSNPHNQEALTKPTEARLPHARAESI